MTLSKGMATFRTAPKFAVGKVIIVMTNGAICTCTTVQLVYVAVTVLTVLPSNNGDRSGCDGCL